MPGQALLAMLCLAMSSWAREVSASASSGNSVDSALASNPRTRSSMRWSTLWLGLVAELAVSRRAVPGMGQSRSSTGNVAKASSTSRAQVKAAVRSIRSCSRHSRK